MFFRLLIFFILVFVGGNSFAEKILCGRIILHQGKVKLNNNEQILVCGSDRVEAWEDVPLSQSQLHLKQILQNLGYLEPKFEIKDNFLNVWSGPLSKIQSLKIQGAEHLLNPAKKRNVVGEALTPQNLNEVEAWANSGIRSQGHACPVIILEAHTWDQSILVKAELDNKKSIANLKSDDLEGLRVDILKRYQPFEIGESYNVIKTQLMADRLLADGLFQSAYFLTACQDDQVFLDLQTSIGKPRIFRFGVGASSEEMPFVDITYKNARLDDKASSYLASLHFSPRLQSFALDSELYFFPGWHKTFLGPRLLLAREVESSYQTDSANLGADIGRRWDFWGTRFRLKGGPTFNQVKTVRGIGPANANYPSIDASLTMMSHYYEAFVRQQYEGWTGSLFFHSQGRGLGSEINVNRYELNFKHLRNVGEYAPPLFVLGTRVQAITVDADELVFNENSQIPIDQRIFAGGDQNLRGFPRKSIDNQGLGYLSFLYLGLELRLIEELPFRLQPFLLWDGAQVGTKRYTLDPPAFTSEGVGLRWHSPFGTLRASFARGRVFHNTKPNDSYPEQWVFFFSFGREF